jgi:hypothetical protein
MKYQIYFPTEKAMEKVHGMVDQFHGASLRVHEAFIK